MLHLQRRYTVAVASLVVLLASMIAPGPASAARDHYTKSARVHVSATARASARATMSATVTASAGNPAVTVTVTARASAERSARATRGAWARAEASAANRSKAVSRARSKAHAAAHRRAAMRARALAQARALAAARSAAHADAVARAKAAALTRARTEAGAATRPAPAPQPCGGSLPKTGGGTWTCTFDDEFDGKSLDTTKWVPLTTAATGMVAGTVGCYTNSPANISESGGTLNLTVRKERAPFTCASGFQSQYTSGQVASIGRFSQAYGRFAVRAAFPAATVAGLQSSLWLYPDATKYGPWPASGEIDIAEEYSAYADRAIPYAHYVYDPSTADPASHTNQVTNNACLINNVSAFHEYVLEWTPTTLTTSYDGRTCLVDNYTSTQGGSAPFDQPFFVTLTQALGLGANAFDPATTPLPATTRVDYVRVWK